MSDLRLCCTFNNWILGITNRNKKEVWMTISPRNQWDTVTLCAVISDHVEITSTIHTDCWKGYYCLISGGFATHLTINHLCYFVDLDTGVLLTHSGDTCARDWAEAQFEKIYIDVYISEDLWKRYCKSHNTDKLKIFGKCTPCIEKC